MITIYSVFVATLMPPPVVLIDRRHHHVCGGVALFGPVNSTMTSWDICMKIDTSTKWNTPKKVSMR